jgi:hypothetical protein
VSDKGEVLVTIGIVLRTFAKAPRAVEKELRAAVKLLCVINDPGFYVLCGRILDPVDSFAPYAIDRGDDGVPYVFLY